MSGPYDHLGNGRTGTVRDHTAAWQRLRAIGDADDKAKSAITAFCERKGITYEALAALGTRVRYDHNVGHLLAYGGTYGNGQITAIKYRPLNGTSHDSRQEEPSQWLRPIVIGKLDSLDWVVAEGETDAARLYDLVGDRCAILVLPLGAKTFKPEWAAVIPRGAKVALCHDADEDGDAGAQTAANVIGTGTIRIRPPINGGDWCDWPGDQDAFLALTRPMPRYEFLTHAEFAAREFPVAEPLLGEPGRIFLARGSKLMAYGADGSGKSTWAIDGIVHMAAGVEWLGIPVPRPVRFCIIENEGPPSLFQQKILDKVASWDGPDPTPNMLYYVSPWGEFTFADPDARTALREFCAEQQVDVVTANPTLGLGVGASGKPDETQQFVGWLVECGLKTTLAFFLLHHVNKAGQISGDWGRHPDTKVFLARDGDAQRTKLDWNKTRWATLDPQDKVVMLEWVTETQGYTVTELPTTATDDSELDERINTHLKLHPGSSTSQVHDNVTGENSRITKRLKARFDSCPGPRNATLWLPLADGVGDPVGSADDEPTGWDENDDG